MTFAVTAILRCSADGCTATVSALVTLQEQPWRGPRVLAVVGVAEHGNWFVRRGSEDHTALCPEHATV